MKILHILKKFFTSFFKETINKQLNILIPIALIIVKKIEEDPSIIIDGSKRNTAIAMITSELISQELQFAKRLINLAIEIAVIEFKGIN